MYVGAAESAIPTSIKEDMTIMLEIQMSATPNIIQLIELVSLELNLRS